MRTFEKELQVLTSGSPVVAAEGEEDVEKDKFSKMKAANVVEFSFMMVVKAFLLEKAVKSSSLTSASSFQNRIDAFAKTLAILSSFANNEPKFFDESKDEGPVFSVLNVADIPAIVAAILSGALGTEVKKPAAAVTTFAAALKQISALVQDNVVAPLTGKGMLYNGSGKTRAATVLDR